MKKRIVLVMLIVLLAATFSVFAQGVKEDDGTKNYRFYPRYFN